MKPAARLLITAAALCGVALVTVVTALPLWAWSISLLLFCIVLVFDFVWVLILPAPVIGRRLINVLPLGVAERVELRVKNPQNRACKMQIHDHHPPSFRATGLPLNVAIPPATEISAGYTIVPTERGEHRFDNAAAWMESRLGFWRRRIRGTNTVDVRVYPDYKPLVRYSLMTVENREGRLGIHKHRRRGTGLEFHQLRDYRFGDAPNCINWKATSRRLKLISCEYQDEQDQQVVLLLDCGRRMRAKDDNLSHFDHVLNAVLLLAHIALRQGDSVGLITFGGTSRQLSGAYRYWI